MNKQINSPWTWFKLKRMTLGPSKPLRPFRVGFRWTKSCKPVTGKLNTFTNFYLKDLTWSDNDTICIWVLNSSTQTTHTWKEKGGGVHPLRLSLQESKSQDLGICLPPQDVWYKVFYLLFYQNSI